MFTIQVKDLDGSGKYIPKFDGTFENAGLDLYSVEDRKIYKGDWEAIKVGIATAMPANMVAIIKDRSSMAGKGITTIGGVIDSSYRGEWKIMLYNFGIPIHHIKRGDKIAQAIFVNCLHPRIEVVNSLPESNRGAKGFGSTGR